MKLLLVLYAAVIVSADNFERFKKQFNKKYASVHDNDYRRKIFDETMAFVNQHNFEHDLGLHTYTVGINQFADWTPEEFQEKMLTYKKSNIEAEEYKFDQNVKAAATVDWRKKGYVTPMKNQGRCGSCWAFSAIGSLEGMNFKKTGKLVGLSEQQLVDCDTRNAGCSGGDQQVAFRYIRKTGGVNSEKIYPYKARDMRCRVDKTKLLANIKGHRAVTNEKSLEQAVSSLGPIAVSTDASPRSFSAYKSGIYYDPRCSRYNINHAMLAVGYGKGYWIIKNSWGTRWGENGYVRMAKDRNSHCGVGDDCSYPIL